MNICNRNFVNLKIVDRDEMNKIVSSTLDENKFVNFVGYWGATKKKELDDNDIITLEHFKTYIEYVSNICKGNCKWVIFLSDIHAYLNGYSDENVKEYLYHVESFLMNVLNTHTIYLSEFWKENDIAKKIEDYKKSIRKDWKNMDLSEVLMKQAMKNDISTRIKEESAMYYYSMRKVESEIITERFNDSIFFTYSTDYMRELYPNLPCLYLWSQKRGTSKPPWLV